MEGKLKGSGREGKGDSLSHNYNYIIVNLKLRNAKLITNKIKCKKISGVRYRSRLEVIEDKYVILI